VGRGVRLSREGRERRVRENGSDSGEGGRGGTSCGRRWRCCASRFLHHHGEGSGLAVDTERRVSRRCSWEHHREGQLQEREVRLQSPLKRAWRHKPE